MIDIVIVNYKSTEFLTECLNSVYETLGDQDAKIFIEDNESDGTIAKLGARCPDLHITRNKKNLGFAKAVNSAIVKCKSKYIILLNPDTIIHDNFFKGAIEFLEKNPKIGILGPKIVNPDGSIQGSARSFPNGWTALFGRNSTLTKWFPNNNISRKNILNCKSDGKNPMSVDWVSGACMIARRSAIKEIGLLDERFFMYWEDADWCRRMRNGGWSVIYYPSLTIQHNVGGSSSKSSVRSVVEFHKSAYKIFTKHYQNGFSILINCLVYLALHLRLLFSLIRVGYNITIEWLKNDRFKERLLGFIKWSSMTSKFTAHETRACSTREKRLKHSILFVNQYYPPDRSATAGVLKSIAMALSEKFNVRILAGRPSYRASKFLKWRPIRLHQIEKASVIRVGSTAFSRRKMTGRILNYFSFLSLSMPVALLSKSDLVIALTDPPLAGMVAAIAAKVRRKPFVYYMQDLHPDMAISAGMIRPGWLTETWERIHFWVMSKADTLIVLGEDMQDRIVRKGIDERKTIVIRHGAKSNVASLNLAPHIIEELRCGFELAVIHAGNIGYYGAWDTLVQAAEKLKTSQAGIVFIGEGAYKSKLKMNANGNDRIIFQPFRSRAEFGNVLAAGDLHLVTILPGLEGTIVPSKLYPILSAGRPVLAVVPSASDVAKIVSQYRCGEVVDPTRPDVLAQVILKYLRHPELLIEMGNQSKLAAQQISQKNELKKIIRVAELHVDSA